MQAKGLAFIHNWGSDSDSHLIGQTMTLNLHLGFFLKVLSLTLLLHFMHISVRADPFIDTIQKRYGAEAFKRAKEIHFTFNAKAVGLTKSRSWIWKPQSDSVTRVDKNISYSRKAVLAELKSLDADFINDQYWLIFPLLIEMDKSATVTVDSVLAPSPIKQELLRKVTLRYPQNIGYSPGDVYDLFVDESGLIKEWVYFKSGKKIGIKWTWEKQESFSGILISQEHAGIVRVFFTGIEVK